MKSDFVACVADLGAFLWESLEGMARDEPGGFDVVFLEELEESGGSYVAGPETWFVVSILRRVTGGRGCVLCIPRLMSLTLSSPP